MAQARSSAIEQATSRDDDGQPAAQAQQQQSSKRGQPDTADHLPLLLGQHDGPASARSLRFVAFSAGQKAEAASYKK